MIKICKFCKIEFETFNENRIFCSVKCGAKWNRVIWNKTKVECEICHKQIPKSSHQKHLNVHLGIKNKCTIHKIECEICHKQISKSQYKKHYNYCLQNDKKIFLKKEWKQENGLYKCPYCQKEYVKKGICTHIYLNHIEGIIPKGGFKKYNKDIKNGIKQQSFKGKHLSEEHKNNLSKSFKNKMKEGWIPAYILYVKSEIGKQELSKRKIKLYEQFPEKHPNRKLANNRKKMSYPEKICYNWLNNNNIKFEHQKHIGKYWVDFFIIDKNLVIEIDGNYWHQNENKERTNYIKQYYQIKRIKAKENIEQKLNQIFIF